MYVTSAEESSLFHESPALVMYVFETSTGVSSPQPLATTYCKRTQLWGNGWENDPKKLGGSVAHEGVTATYVRVFCSSMLGPHWRRGRRGAGQGAAPTVRWDSTAIRFQARNTWSQKLYLLRETATLLFARESQRVSS